MKITDPDNGNRQDRWQTAFDDLEHRVVPLSRSFAESYPEASCPPSRQGRVAKMTSAGVVLGVIGSLRTPIKSHRPHPSLKPRGRVPDKAAGQRLTSRLCRGPWPLNVGAADSFSEWDRDQGGVHVEDDGLAQQKPLGQGSCQGLSEVGNWHFGLGRPPNGAQRRKL